MFRTFIYLDTDKLYSYKRQIEGTNQILPKTANEKKTKSLTAGIEGMGVNVATETNVTGEFEKDISFDYDRFELALERLDGDDYFDCVLNGDYDPQTVPPMKIFRINAGFSVPEEFDIVNLINQFKPMLMGQIGVESDSDQEALETFLGKASADIPIVVDYDDIMISGKLNAKYLLEDYTVLEDYAEQAVYLLCKVVGISRKENVEIFDPLKDFIHLSRIMRKELEKDANNAGLEKIKIQGPVLKVEIIAIYK